MGFKDLRCAGRHRCLCSSAEVVIVAGQAQPTAPVNCVRNSDAQGQEIGRDSWMSSKAADGFSRVAVQTQQGRARKAKEKHLVVLGEFLLLVVGHRRPDLRRLLEGVHVLLVGVVVCCLLQLLQLQDDAITGVSERDSSEPCLEGSTCLCWWGSGLARLLQLQHQSRTDSWHM